MRAPDRLSSSSLDWALAHTGRFGDTDIFPVPFEFEAIRACWPFLRGELETTDLGEYRTRASQQILMPKSRTGFRIAVQLDPFDALVYAAMLYESADFIERYRVPSRLGIACSYRLNVQADGSLFEAETGWPTYHRRSVELTKSGRFTHVLTADITDFYNQVSHHRVNNVLQSAGVPQDRCKDVESFLSKLGAKHSRGLPVGPSASIVLAEASLDDVDKFLMSRGLDYVRYVDDFRIFCTSERVAIEAAHALTEYLYTSHRLALAASKTRRYTIKSFREHELLDPAEEERRGRISKLSAEIQEILENTGYQVGFDDLAHSTLSRVTRENLVDLFRESVQKRPVHLGSVRYLLRRAKQLRTVVLKTIVMENLGILAPALRDAIEYLVVATKPNDLANTTRSLLKFLREDPSGSLPFVRLWVLEFFVRRPLADSYPKLLKVAEESRESLGIRPVALLSRACRQVQWVRSQRERWANHAPWDRRAIIWAGSILPDDERRHWLAAIKEAATDALDRAVAIQAGITT